MPSEKFSNVAVAVGATTGNLLANSKFLYAPGPMLVRVFAITDTVGGLLSLSFGNTIEVDRAVMNSTVAATALTGPRMNEDQIAQGVAMGGDQINCSWTNGSAAVMTGRVLIEMRPL